MLVPRLSGLLLLSISLSLFAGCSESGKQEKADVSHGHEHDHEHGHKHAETLKDAVKELAELRDTVRDAFAKNDPDAAHDPLHEVGHVLGNISVFAQKEGVSAEEQSKIETAVTELMDSFGAVDKTMHGQEGSAYSEVSTKIDETVSVLMVAAGLAETPAAETPAAETPAVETPAAETPAVETPAAETPAAETPAAETPAAESSEPVAP